MAADPENLVAFLAREHDAMAESPGSCPDENLWASLEAGLISPGQRDELLTHARDCAPCRRRMSEIVAEWPADVTVAERTAADPSPERERRGVLFRIGPRHYAIAAALLMAVTLWLAWPGGRPDASLLGTPIARLTDFDDVGILHRRTLSETADPQREQVIELAARQEDYANKHPTDADAWGDLARAQLRLGRIAEASRAADRAVGIALQRDDLHNLAGLIAYRAGRHEAAAAAFAEAIRLAPNTADYHVNAALALEELQRIEEAVRHWRQFLRLAPTDTRAEEAARWLSLLEAGNSGDPSGP